MVVPNPYLNRMPEHTWKTGVAALAPRSIAPIRAKRFTIGNGSWIATAGSCFAQEIGKRLASMPGAALLRAETAGSDQPLFSALYGNIYTTRQLVQLLDRAFDIFLPLDNAWRRADGRYVDPFRPYMFAAGFAAVEDVANARQDHLAAVRRVFMDCSVFIFTLGLTEGWRARADGAVFPVAPGIVSDEADSARYAFHNFTYAEALADIRDIVTRLRSVNPVVRVILTVSPTPLAATYTAEHVIVATMHSKSILRAVCSEAEAEFDLVYYFPSYEIISGHFNRGQYYGGNLRTVTAQGIEHVMAVFRQTYFDAQEQRKVDKSPAAMAPETPLDQLVCDEEDIVRSVGFDCTELTD